MLPLQQLWPLGFPSFPGMSTLTRVARIGER